MKSIKKFIHNKLVKQSLSILVLLVLVVSVTFSNSVKVQAINVKNSTSTIVTNKITARIELNTAVEGEQVCILVDDEANAGKFRVFNTERFDVQSDANGKFVIIKIPKIPESTNPDTYVTTLVNDSTYNVKLASNVVGNDNLDASTPYTSVKIKVDTVAPSASPVNIVSTNSDKSKAKNGDKIKVAFTTSEDVQTPVVTIFGRSANITGSGTNWTADYTIPTDEKKLPDGEATFNITFADLAGNVVSVPVSSTTDSTKVTYDSPPIATSVNIISDAAHTSYARNGNTITLTFSTNKDINNPSVTILGQAATTVTGSGMSWTATYNIPSNETSISDGNVNFTINFADSAGNAVQAPITATTDGSTVSYQINSPTASEVKIASDNTNPKYAKNGNIVTLTFTTSVNVQAPTATILGNAAVVTAAVAGNQKKWIAQYTIPAVDVTSLQGEVPFSINFTDFVGNVGGATTTDGSSVTYDRAAPTASSVTIASNNHNPTYAKNGDKITVSFITNENIQKPTVSIFGIKDDSISVSGDGINWRAEYTIPDNEDKLTEGLVNFSINFNDAADNPAAEVQATTDESSVTYGRAAPEILVSNIASNNINPLFGKNGDIVTVNFTTKKAIQTPVVSIGGRSATVSKRVEGSDTEWKATYIIPTTESELKEESLALSISMLDMAGNYDVIDKVTDSSSVTYKRTPPATSSVSIANAKESSKYAKNGDKIIVTFTTNEDVQLPKATILGRTADKVTGSGTNWVAEYTIPDLESTLNEGVASFSLSFNDLAGNPVSSDVTQVTDSTQVTYDRTPPTATSVSIATNNGNTKYAKNGDKITVTFVTSEEIQAPIATILDHAAEVKGSGVNWTAEYTIPADEASQSEGQASFSLSFNDLASNEAIPVTTVTDASSVLYDRTSPIAKDISIIKTSGTNNNNWVKEGDSFKLRFTLDDTDNNKLNLYQVSSVDNSKVSVKIGNTSAIGSLVSGTTQNGTYEATFTASGDTLVGLKEYEAFVFEINYSDIEGNDGSNVTATTDGSSLRYDNSASIIKYFFNSTETDSSNLQSYYKSNKLAIQITEHNFDPNGITVEGNNIKPTNWINKGNDLWQMDITMPDSNNNTLKVTAVDAVGNKSINDLTNSKSFSIDTTVPVIKYLFNGTGTDKPSRYYKASQQVAIQISEHNFNPEKTSVTGNGISPTSWSNKGNDLWEMVINLNEGNDYTLNVNTTDNGDNSASKSLDTFTIDLTKPVVSIQNIFGGFFKGILTPKVVYSDINLDPNSVSIKLNGAEKGPGTAAAATFEKAFSIKADGTYDLSVLVQDLAGNVSTQDMTFVLDNTAPKITSMSIDLKNPVAYPMGWIPGKELQIDDANGFDIVTSTLNGADYDMDTRIMNEGKNTLYLKVMDKSGNVSSLTYQFFIDNTAPKVICMDSKNNVVLDSTSQDAVFISQMNLNVYLDKIEIGNEKQDAFTDILLEDEKGNVVQDLLNTVGAKTEGGEKSYSVVLTKFQNYKLVVKARDDVGNVASNTYAFTLKDKSIWTKYYENKAAFYSSITIFALLIIGFAGFGFTRLGRKTKI